MSRLRGDAMDDKIADEAVEKLRGRIEATYAQAARELQAKLRDHLARSAATSERLKADVAAGRMSKKDYQDWLRMRTLDSDRWQQQIDEAASILTEADRKAAEMINGAALDVFAANANETAVQMTEDANGGISFTLYDSSTVQRLVEQEPELMMRREIDGRKADAWHVREISNAVTQAIIQGESIAELSARIARDTGISAGRSSMLYARTCMTSAQNAGRIDRMHQAQHMGIKVRKVWLSCGDDRVREAHEELDGHDVDVDEPFDSILGPIDYPGDPGAAPENVWNCRCSLGYNYPEHPNDVDPEEWPELEPEEEDPWERMEFGPLFTQEQQEAVAETLREAQAEYPLPYKFDFVGDGRISRGLPDDLDHMDLQQEYNVNEAAQYMSVLRKDKTIEHRIDIIDESRASRPLPEVFDRLHKSHKGYEADPSRAHALFEATYGMQGLIWHEYGHAVQDYCGFFLRQTPEGTAFQNWLIDYKAKHPKEVMSISLYATTNYSEMFAEAFVTWRDTHHDTMAWQTSNEIMLEFERRFGDKFDRRRR